MKLRLLNRDNAVFTRIERLDYLTDHDLTHQAQAVEYFKFVGFWDTYKKYAAFCRIMGHLKIVGFWDL